MSDQQNEPLGAIEIQKADAAADQYAVLGASDIDTAARTVQSTENWLKSQSEKVYTLSETALEGVNQSVDGLAGESLLNSGSINARVILNREDAGATGEFAFSESAVLDQLSVDGSTYDSENYEIQGFLLSSGKAQLSETLVGNEPVRNWTVSDVVGDDFSGSLVLRNKESGSMQVVDLTGTFNSATQAAGSIRETASITVVEDQGLQSLGLTKDLVELKASSLAAGFNLENTTFKITSSISEEVGRIAISGEAIVMGQEYQLSELENLGLLPGQDKSSLIKFEIEFVVADSNGDPLGSFGQEVEVNILSINDQPSFAGDSFAGEPLLIKNTQATSGREIDLELNSSSYTSGGGESQELTFQFTALPTDLGTIKIGNDTVVIGQSYTATEFASSVLVLKDLGVEGTARVKSDSVKWQVSDGEITLDAEKMIAVDNKPMSTETIDAGNLAKAEEALSQLNEDTNPIKVTYVAKGDLSKQALAKAAEFLDAAAANELSTVITELTNDPDVLIVPTISISRYDSSSRVVKSYQENASGPELTYEEATDTTKEYLLGLAVQSTASTAALVGANRAYELQQNITFSTGRSEGDDRQQVVAREVTAGTQDVVAFLLDEPIDLELDDGTVRDVNDLPFLKFYSQELIDEFTARGLELVDLDGNQIESEGVYDFTRRNNAGNGGEYIMAGNTIVGVKLFITDNEFGDKNPLAGYIVDPVTIGVVLENLGTETTTIVDNRTTSDSSDAAASSAVSFYIPNLPMQLQTVGSGQSGEASSFGNGLAGDGLRTEDGDGLLAMMVDGLGGASTVDSTSSSASEDGQGLAAVSDPIEQTSNSEGPSEKKTQDFIAAGPGGQDTEGDANDQSQRRRGLQLNPEAMAISAGADRTVLQELSQQSVMGYNLLDALALGAGMLYLLYAPKLREKSKPMFAQLWDQVRNRGVDTADGLRTAVNGGAIFVMQQAPGQQQLVVCQVGAGNVVPVGTRDLPAGFDLNAASSARVIAELSRELRQLLDAKLDLLLLGAKLAVAQDTLAADGTTVQVMGTNTMLQVLGRCSGDELEKLNRWIDKPSMTSIDDLAVRQQLKERMEVYSTMMPEEQANVVSLLELSIAMTWNDKKESSG